MHAQIEIENHQDYIQVKMHGDRRNAKDLYSEIWAVWEEISRAYIESEVNKLLILSHIKGSLDTVTTYKISSNLYKLGLNSNTKIALVEFESEAAEQLEFGVTVGFNRGITACFFDNVKEAKKWLSE